MGQEPGKYYIVLCVGNYGLSFELFLQGALSYDIQFKVFISVSYTHLDVYKRQIYISAGVRGLQLKIAPAELIAFVGATVAEISREG